MIIDLIAGAVLALATIWLFKQFPVWAEYTAWCVALIVAAFVYVGFALGRADAPWTMIEAAGVVYGAAAIAGLLFSSWFLAIGWIAHVLWDLALHTGPSAHFVPEWYPVACLTYDVIVGVYIIRQREKWVSAGLPRPGWNKLVMSRRGVPDRS